MGDLRLIYINKVGIDYLGKYIYEFMFSDIIKDIDGDGWDENPAAGRPSPPQREYIKKVGRLEAEILFELIQYSSMLGVWDAVDGVIALGYENIDDYESYPESRLHFHFGDTIKDVENKLYEKDLILQYKK
jgi:hypothetical protein